MLQIRASQAISKGSRAFCGTAAVTRGYSTDRVSTASPRAQSHKVVVVGGGAAGSAISHQLLRSGKYKQDDIAVVDPATWHHYQPGWTLVGGGLAHKDDFKLRLAGIIDSKIRLYGEKVCTFTPEENSITLGTGDRLHYEQLVVCPGISTNYDKIKGLPEALADPSSPVSTIYGYDTCDKVFATIKGLRSGRAIFSQPSGILKCAGAPQKAMWLALDYWKRAGLFTTTGPGSSSPISISFATGLPVMFGVAKYNAKLTSLVDERRVEGLFEHDLVAVDGNVATFARPDGSRAQREFDLLHAVPKLGPHESVAASPLADAAGLVAVDPATLRHARYGNVWAAGDAAGLPTSKTAAAITAQTPVLVANLLRVAEGREPEAEYDGYTSCPLVTEYGKVLLAEFKYGGEPKETFGRLLGIDQAEPRRLFYHLKKDFFPWVYKKYMVRGKWAGPNGFIR